MQLETQQPERRRRLAGKPLLSAMLLGVGALAIAVLSLSDRVPVLLERATAFVDPRLERMVDPLMDLGHVAVWAAMASATLLVVTHPRGRAAILLALAGTATALELGQAVASSTRTSTVADAQSNLIGIALGAVIGLLLTSGAREAPRSRTP